MSLASAVDRGDELATSPVCVEEIVRGMRAHELEAVRVLFDGLEVVAVDRSHAEVAGTWRREFAAQGITLTQADMLIAACAHLSGATLVTNNVKDFPIDGPAIEVW